MRTMHVATIVAALFACACGEAVQPTQLLIVVSSELGNEVTSVEAQILDESETREGQRQLFNMAPPFSFGVQPAGKDLSTRQLIRLTGRDAATNVVAVAKAVVTFVPNKTVQLDLRLLQACRGVLCAGGQTCVAASAGPGGQCAAVPVVIGNIVESVTPNSEFTTIPGSATAADGSAPSVEGDSGVMTPSTLGTGGPAAPFVPDASVAPPVTGGMTDGSVAPIPAVDAGPVGPAPECSPTLACAAGYNCVSNKCVSMCEQTSCDPNATCAIVGGRPLCMCGSGFISRQEASGAVTCMKDVKCSDLNCHMNAACEMGPDNLPVCKCRPGYQGSGTTCTPISCPAQTLMNGTVSGQTTYNSTITYRCNTGYLASSAQLTRTCGVDGNWSGSAPTCQAVDCGALTNPENGRVTTAGGTTYGATARYSCNSGYQLDSLTDTRTCGVNMTWSGSAPRCLGCGDRTVTTGFPLYEECDSAALGETAWTCSSTCKKNTLYTGCLVASQCASGQMCFSGQCTISCASGGGCPAVGGLPAQCIPSTGVCTATACSRDAQCAPGFMCTPSPGAGFPSMCLPRT